jgi:hypothetical protein
MSAVDTGGNFYGIGGGANNPLPNIPNTGGSSGNTVALASPVANISQAAGTCGNCSGAGFPAWTAQNPGVRIGESIRFVGMWGGQLVRGAHSSTSMLWMPGQTGCYVYGHAGDPADCPAGMLAFGGSIWPYYTTDGGNTWHNALLCNAPGPVNNCGKATLAPGFDSVGRSRNGPHLALGTGMGGGPNSPYLGIAADRVQPGTYYLLVGKHAVPGADDGGGIYMSNDGGVTWIRNWADTVDQLGIPGGTSPQAGAKLAAVPGHAGHVFWVTGAQGGFISNTGPFANGGFYRSCDANSTTPGTSGAHWYPVDTSGALVSAGAFGFGAPTPGGNGYPDLYMYGWVNVAGTPTQGLWRGQPSATCSPTETVTWTQIGYAGVGYLANVPIDVTGDMNHFGYFYMADPVSGGSWGYHQ